MPVPRQIRGFALVALATLVAPGFSRAQVGDAPEKQKLELSINDAIRISIVRNLDLQVDRLNYDLAVKDIVIAKAVFDPIFQTSYTMSKFRAPTIDALSGVAGSITTIQVNPFTNQAFDIGLSGLTPIGTSYSITAADNRGDSPDNQFLGFNPRNDTSIRGQITQPLLKDFGTTVNLADLRISRNAERISDLGFRRNLQVTVASVHTAYWNLVFAIKDVEVKEKALEEAQTLLEINRHKVEVGSAKRIDIVDAEANVETQKSGLIQARAVVEKARDDLLDVLNYREVLREDGALNPYEPPYANIEVVPTTDLSATPYEVDIGQALQLALLRREDLQQAKLDVENAQIDLERRKHQLLPSLNLTGSWAQRGLEENVGNSVDELFSGRYYDWSLGLALEYPLGNRSEESLLAKARTNLDIARIQLQQRENEIVLEVTQVVRDINTAYQQVRTNQEVVRLRREQFDGETQRLRVGTSTAYQVQQVQNDLLEAETLLLRALVDYKLAITDYQNSVGIILETTGEL